MFIIIMFLSYMCVGFRESLLGVAWPYMRDAFGFSEDYLGYIILVIYLGMFLAANTKDIIARKIKLGLFLSICSFSVAMCFFLIYLCTSKIALLALFLIMGIGFGYLDSITNSYVAKHYTSSYLTILQCFYGFGTSISPLILSAVITRGYVWNYAYLILAILELIVACLTIIIINKVKTDEVVVKKEEVHTNIKFDKKLLILPILVILFNCAMNSTITLWSPTYLSESRNLTTQQTALLVSLIGTGITAGRVVGCFLLTKADDEKVIDVSEILILISFVLFAVLSSSNLNIAYLGYGLGSSLVYPLILHEAAKRSRFNKALESSIVSKQLAAGYVGCSVIPSIAGNVMNRFGFNLFIYIVIIFYVLFMVFDFLWRKKTEYVE